MNRRLLAVTLLFSFGSSSGAFAGESLLQSGARIIEQAVRVEVSSDRNSTRPATPTPPGALASRINRPVSAALAAQEPALSESGMSRRKKWMIFIAAGVGFAASAYAIDHNVLDITPSSLGKRKD